MISSTQLRQLRFNFRISKNHKQLPEVSLIADKTSTALFNVAGMQPLIPYLMGKPHPLGKKLFNIQKCIRTVDIDEVGDASHLTFFEMMGNWSLGDYFKKDAIHRSREFLTKVLNFDPRKLAVTVFAGDENAPRDEETASYREEEGKKSWINLKISYLPAKNNRRSPGPVGPCGPDTEIFYRVGESEFPPESSNVENDEDNRMEIRNNVFMEYYRDEAGKLSKLTQQNVDTGMGFERMCSVLQHVESVYETDLFTPMLQVIARLTGSTYTDHIKPFRIIADHARTAFMLINDGLLPSNIWAGYVLRMIIRRMVFNIKLLGDISYENIIKELLESVKDLRAFDQEEIIRVMMEEINLFNKTVREWHAILIKLINTQDPANKTFSGNEAFKLYDTYGFPLELTKNVLKEHGLTLDEEGFHKAMSQAKEKSRQSTKEMFKKGIDWSKYLEGIPQTEFIGYENLNFNEAKLLKRIEIPTSDSTGKESWQEVLVFDKTPFYPEMWGQMWDFWEITLENGETKKVTNVQKFAGVILHFVA